MFVILGVCTDEFGLDHVWLTLLSSVLRHRQYAASILPTKRSSFAPTLRYILFPSSYATLFKPLVRSSTSCGLSKSVHTSAHYAQLKRLSSKSVTYGVSFFTAKRKYLHLSYFQVGTAIFTFVIASHTFSQLFLRRQWSDRTCYIILIASWGLLALDLCIGNFIIADPKGRGPYYGVAGYWCWITPAYPVERYTTEYLFMFASAGFSLILYLLVFFRLRGNITVPSGYKVQFHQRPKVRVGRTNAGTYIMTDDRRVESHLTTVAKQMLWYPITYSVLVLPVAAARFPTFSGASVPFGVTILTAAVFMLSGFVNTLLFCTTRNVLPGSWRQRLGIGTTLDSRRSNVGLPSQANPTSWFSDTRSKTVGVGTTPALSINVVKDVETLYELIDPGSSFLRFDSPSLPASPVSPASPASPASPTPLLRAYSSGGQRSDTQRHYARQSSSPVSRDARMSAHIEEEGGEKDSGLGTGVRLVSKAMTDALEVSRFPGHALGGYESGTYGLAQAPTSSHPYAMALPVTNTPRAQTPSILIPETAVSNPRRLSWASGHSGSGMRWTGYNR
jgi:hypothetical protein